MDLMVILSIFTAGLIAATPLIITALGGLYSEKSGIVNIGLEGMMTFGAFLGATAIALLEPSIGYIALPIGIIFGAIGGGLFGLLHAYLTISQRADQVISGTAINMLALGMGVYLSKAIFNSAESPAKLSQSIQIPGTDIYILSIAVIIFVFVTWFIMSKTPWGLRVRACGEYPEAAAAMGVNVKKIRYQAVVLSGVLAGIGGMSIVLLTAGKFAGFVIAGKGFIALAVLIFGRWNPFGILAAGLFFGITTNIATTITIIFPEIQIATVWFDILPYILTIIALILFSRSSVAPASLGREYNN